MRNEYLSLGGKCLSCEFGEFEMFEECLGEGVFLLVGYCILEERFGCRYGFRGY